MNYRVVKTEDGWKVQNRMLFIWEDVGYINGLDKWIVLKFKTIDKAIKFVQVGTDNDNKVVAVKL